MRPTVVTVLAVLHCIAGALLVFGGLGSIAVSRAADLPGGGAVLAAFAGLLTLYGVAHLVCAIGLWTLKPYGRTL